MGPPPSSQPSVPAPPFSLFDDDDDFGGPVEPPPSTGRPPAGAGRPSLPSAAGPSADLDPDATGLMPAPGHAFDDEYEPMPTVPRRVDLPDDVFAPKGTGGRRITDRMEGGEPDADDAYDPYAPPPLMPEDRITTEQTRRPGPPSRRPLPPEEPEPHTGAAVAIGISVAVGLLLGVAGAFGLSVGKGVIGSAAAGFVIAVMSSVVVRRGLGLSWWISGLIGVIPGALVLAVPFGPSWAKSAAAVGAAGIAGAASVLLTRPVRRLSYLVLEYVTAVGLALAGGGAVVGILQGSPLGRGNTAIAIVLGFGIALGFAARARARFGESEATDRDHLFYAGLVAAVVLGAGATAVLFGVGKGSFLANGFGKVESLILDFRLIVIIPLAMLGSAVVVRALTSAGWWICAVTALSTSAMAAAFGGSAGGGRADIAPTLASAFVGYVLGFVVTVIVAMGMGARMRAQAARRARPGEARVVREPGRLGAL